MTAAIVIQADLAVNADLSSNNIRCHDNVDLKTSAGDLVLTETEDEYILQKLIMWLATALGERVDRPDLGCALWDFMHEQLDSLSLTMLSRSLEYGLKKQIPELNIQQVICSTPANSNTVNIEFITTDGQVINRIAGSEYFDLVDDLSDMLWSDK